ncbi:MAG: hypothetical protein HY702_00505 [Gemmatimonadetes bacterium]|nr:hypothetical protein [Gemmatimonadota bacterium]
MAVLVIALIASSIALNAYSTYLRKTSAQRAAEVFAADLALARSSAIRSRRNISIIFQESSLAYVLRSSTGVEIARRSFAVGADLRLDALDLELAGDSLAFNSRGFADLSGATGSVGRATFRTGSDLFGVSFNALGGSRIERL